VVLEEGFLLPRSGTFPEELTSHESLIHVSDLPPTSCCSHRTGVVPVPWGEIEMKDIVGSPGTMGGLGLRVSQFVCAAASLAAMGSAYGFSNYSAFW
jgi:hypothetical protein